MMIIDQIKQRFPKSAPANLINTYCVGGAILAWYRGDTEKTLLDRDTGERFPAIDNLALGLAHLVKGTGKEPDHTVCVDAANDLAHYNDREEYEEAWRVARELVEGTYTDPYWFDCQGCGQPFQPDEDDGLGDHPLCRPCQEGR